MGMGWHGRGVPGWRYGSLWVLVGVRQRCLEKYQQPKTIPIAFYERREYERLKCVFSR